MISRHRATILIPLLLVGLVTTLCHPSMLQRSKYLLEVTLSTELTSRATWATVATRPPALQQGKER